MPAFTTQDQMTSLSPRVYSHDLKSWRGCSRGLVLVFLSETKSSL